MHLCASLINDPSVDAAVRHPICHHQPCWSGTYNDDIHFANRALRDHVSISTCEIRLR